MLAKLIKPIWWIIHAWAILCIVTFVSGFIVTFVGAPRWLRLPWSDFGDFVESSDGKVFIDIGFYSRVLCYDFQGKFLASYSYPFGNAKDVELAASHDGRVFFRTQEHLYIYDTAWNEQSQLVGEFYSERNWVLDEQGHPIFIPNPIKSKVVNALAKPGDRIFASSSRRKKFECNDGSTLAREGNSLKRYDKNGGLLTEYTTPIYFRPFTFFWPAFLAWPYFFLYAYVVRKRKSLQKHSDSNAARKKLPIDAIATSFTFIICAVAIVVGSTVIIAIANAQPKDSPWGFWLVPVFVIPWWLLVIFGGWISWSAVQKKLAKSTRNAKGFNALSKDSTANTLISDSQSKQLKEESQKDSQG